MPLKMLDVDKVQALPINKTEPTDIYYFSLAVIILFYVIVLFGAKNHSAIKFIAGQKTINHKIGKKLRDTTSWS
jgi:hypothetical protein